MTDDADRMEMGSVVNIALNSLESEANTSTAIQSAFRTPRHQLSIKKSLRRPLQQTIIPPGASAVLASREAAEKEMATTGSGLVDWLAQYFAKVGIMCTVGRGEGDMFTMLVLLVCVHGEVIGPTLMATCTHRKGGKVTVHCPVMDRRDCGY